VRANPGGYISPAETVGRDHLIDSIWRRLEGQSVLLTSERRIGKTCVIRKMRESVTSELCFLRDIEGLHSPGELIQTIYTDLEPILTKGERIKQKFFRILDALGGLQIKDVKLPAMQPHWQELLTAVVGDALEAHGGRVLFFWDEMPLFIYNVAKTCGDKEAMSVLDNLRSLRQSYPTLRMVFTGSVGMHQVVKSLRLAGYANAPTNDMAIIEVPALAPKDGQGLAADLLLGEQMAVQGSLDAVAAELSNCASHIPFYIHTLVARIRDRSQTVNLEAVTREADQLIRDPNDPVDFGYYEKRISIYYEPGQTGIALTALDAVAASPLPLSIRTISNAVKHQVPGASDQDTRQVVGLLLKDHYLQKNDNGAVGFKHLIVKRWWKFARTS
jgi:hypothetical protein